MVSGFFRRVFEFALGKGVGGESVRYLAVGVLTTAVNFGLFVLMTGIFNIDVTISNVTSISVSVLFAYVANKLVVFRRRSGSLGHLALEFCKFVGARLFTMALEIVAVELFYNVLGYDARLGKAAALALVVVTNYLISKLIVFRSSG